MRHKFQPNFDECEKRLSLSTFIQTPPPPPYVPPSPDSDDPIPCPEPPPPPGVLDPNYIPPCTDPTLPPVGPIGPGTS